MVVDMSVQKHITGLPQASKGRRQNHSCDQCRKSKRACDASSSQRSPCSYCARTKKRCTMEWARSRAQSGLKLSRQQSQFERLLFPYVIDERQNDTGFGSFDSLLDLNSMQDPMAWESGNVELSGSSDYDLIPVLNGLEPPEQMQEMPDIMPDMVDSTSSANCLFDLLPPELPDFSSASDGSAQPPSDLELDLLCHQTWTSQASHTSPTYDNTQDTQTSSKPPRQQSDSTWMPFEPHSPRWNSPPLSLSPFSIDQQLITASNNHLTSANLLQIYHDVIEHNLSCWLTETTCPYQPASQNTPKVAPTPEWGSSWSNRIYQRTIKLDRAAQSSKFLQLTQAEDRAASKALHLSIMAFATQWAQGSHRHREKYPYTSVDNDADEIENNMAGEFDRVLQNHFWDQAQRALRQVADVESYRVVCAELIFGLTQRPWNSENQSFDLIEEQGHRFGTDFVLSQVRDIMRQDGPPIYIESAARKMHALKYRWDARERGLDMGFGNRPGSLENDTHDIAGMSSGDRATIGLLYWLAIMFDTVSSSMNERPVVVLDEDCQHEAQRETERGARLEQARWDLDLFVPGGLDKTHQTHWPCSYDIAAEDVTQSAPVKVLLFRHVSYLQNAVRKGASKVQVEDIIRSSTLLYQYWNKTHGAFFTELMQDYSAVPQRIQGWFVFISAHWHLAALMFADLLEFIDGNGLGIEDAACDRITTQLASKIRRHSAAELSDLARVATPAATDIILGLPQLPGFHHAVNEGTLLTEPWTMILIRAFTKACVIFLGEADESSYCSGSAIGLSRHEFERNIEQAEGCIRGLWLLGKKSDMARRIAQTLSLGLLKVQNGQ